MAGTLTFPIDDTLKFIVEHSAGTPGPFYGETIAPCVFLVKDEGAYLMSAAGKRQMKPDGKGCVVAYSREAHPGMSHDDRWEAQQRICGGDDFGEPLDRQFLVDAIARGATELTIQLDVDSLTMEAR